MKLSVDSVQASDISCLWRRMRSYLNFAFFGNENLAPKIRGQEGKYRTASHISIERHRARGLSGNRRCLKGKTIAIYPIFEQFLSTHHIFSLPDPIKPAPRRVKSRATACHSSIAVVIALSFACVAATAREASRQKEWNAPASEAAKKNPVAASQDSIRAGEKVYTKRCLACHGNTGNGDGPDAADLGIYPAKFSDPRLRKESDGAFYWKITIGKKPMPAYGTRLSPTDRWNVINYLRTLAK